MKFILRFARTLGASLLCGVVVGILSGLVEISFLSLTATQNAGRMFFPAVAFYGFFWSVVSFALGFVFFILSFFARSLSEKGELNRWLSSMMVPLALFVILGGHANRAFLPGYASPPSLLFSAFFLIVNLGIGIWLYRKGIGLLSGWLQQFPRWLWILLLLGAIAAVVLRAGFLVPKKEKAETTEPAPTSLPNLLLISVDALRPDHMSYFGYERETTPHLDQMAREGMVLTQAYANSSWTRAAVATMFTSLYPSTHGVNGIATGLSPSLSILPELLKSKGYAAGIFSANAFVAPLFGYAQGVDRFHYRQVSMFNELILGHILRSLRKYSPVIHKVYDFLENLEFPFLGETRKTTGAEGLNQAFLEWVQTLQGRPFFAYFHYMESHTPYATPAPFDKKFADLTYERTQEMNFPLQGPFYPFSKAEPLPPERFENLVAHYDGAVAYVDHKVGELFAELRALGLFDNTAIFVTADHGEEFYDHQGWGHGKSLFNELIHVPLIMSAPFLGSTPRQIEARVQHIDLLPTLSDLAKISPSSVWEGQSLLPLLKGESWDGERPVYSEVIHDNSYGRSVIRGEMKLIELHHHEKEAWLLFDLEKDPEERSPLDLASHPEAPSFKALIASFAEKAARGAVAPETAEIDDETLERLKTLGYIQ